MFESVSKANLVALIVAGAFFMQSLDSTIVTTALPQMAVSLAVDPLHLSVAITAYIASVAVFIPISGWLADRFGARTVFQIAMGVFTLGSALCAFATNVPELVAARILQGIGGAMLVPVGRLIVLRTAERSEFVRAMAFLSVPAQIGPLLGPPVGGFITTYASWQWIFLINVPIGIFTIAIASMFIANDKGLQRRPLDWVGFALTGASMSCIIYALDALGHGFDNGATIVGFLAAGIAIGVVAIRHVLRHKHPIIDLSLLHIATFRANFWGGTLFRIGAGATPFLIPLLLQVVIGLTAFASGLLTFAGSLGALTMKATTPAILRRFGFRTVLVKNAVLCSAGLLAFGSLRDSTPTLVTLAILFVVGFVQSLQFSSLNVLAYADVDSPRMSAATGLAQLVQQLSNGAGVAIAAILLHMALVWNGAAKLTTADFLFAFSVIAAVSAASLVSFMALRPDCGAELTGHRSD